MRENEYNNKNRHIYINLINKSTYLSNISFF